MTGEHFIGSILKWRVRHIGQRQFLLLLSIVAGLFSGLAAVVLMTTLYYTHFFLTNGFNFAEGYPVYLLYPVAGIVLTVLFIRYVVREDISHGVSKVLYSISRNSSRLSGRNNWASLAACTLTLGFGGSVGPEGPIVLAGSSIGSNLGRMFRQDYPTRTLLIGCGAAGAIAGIFKAPIAGVVFVIEILMLDLTMATLIPLMISSLTGSLVAWFFMGNAVLFSFTVSTPFHPAEIPAYLLLGAFAGLVSIYFIHAGIFTEKRVRKIPARLRYPLAGLLLAGMIYLYPSLFGEGYTVLKSVLHGHGEMIGNPGVFGFLKSTPSFIPLLLLMLILLKVIAMGITLGSGGIGGTFAPSLFVGGISGYLLAFTLNHFLGMNVPVSNFALAGMAGVMAGVMHAPLTAIFLIAEITGGYELFIPLIVVATLSYLISHAQTKHSIYTIQLVARNDLITHDKDQATLSQMTIRGLIETNFNQVRPADSLRDLVRVVSSSNRNIYPVVDEENQFHGLVTLDSIRSIMFDTGKYDTVFVRDLIIAPDCSIRPDDPVETLMQLFRKSDRYNVPVLENGKYIGFISRATVFSQYREVLRKFTTVAD